MSSRRRGRCLSCEQLFRANPRIGRRQKYCDKEPCRRAAKAAQQRRWLGKPDNTDYFRGPENAARVRAWQRAHPGYWRNTRRYKSRALQESRPAQVPERAEDFGRLALQESMRCQVPILLGLIATLTDSTLQEDMLASTRRLLQLGQDILGGRASDGTQTGLET